ncbi:MAG: helix-turn-helix domain-containing protein [Acidimicrobiales bacterium]
MAPLLLRPEEAAVLLGIGRTRVFDLIRSGELRSVKIGNSRRVSPTALAEFVEGLGAGDIDEGAERKAG